ncbi:membrane-spanning 4-domains subfamily A member 3 isoform X2 [Arvicanthis niloticus]|uniref:membrane-spanning 4-domains subfamily A member 3 isoform X2 n=1 Tax=Arvicanthis niloticus TaxID=61156 RepID=UPI00402BEAFE
MASQELHNTELGISAGGTSPGRHMEPEETGGSVYQPLDESHHVQRGILQALGFIGSGSLTVAAGRNPTRMLMQNSFGMNVASTTIAFVGTAFLSVHLTLNTQVLKGCQSSLSPDVCVLLGSSSNGLVSLMLILTLLELGITISISAMWCLGNVCGSREAITSPPNSVESGIPPEGSNSENLNTQPQSTEE